MFGLDVGLAAAAAVLLAAGATAGFALGRFTLRLEKARLEEALERAEMLLNVDGNDAAKTLNTTLDQLTQALDATKTASENARIAEQRVTALTHAFRDLREDKVVGRLASNGRSQRLRISAAAEDERPAASAETPLTAA
jgi:hypothetical protein